MPPTEQKHLYDYFIDEHGNWSCEGNPVLDQELFRMLSRSLFEKEGRFFIRCEGEVHPVRVEDAPLMIRYVHIRTDSAKNLTQIEIELADGRREPLAAETLVAGCEHGLYCLATRRRLRARFSKIAYYELAGYIEADEGDESKFFLVLNGRRYDIAKEP